MSKNEELPTGDCRRSCCGGCIVGPLLLFAVVAGADDVGFGVFFLLPLFSFLGAALVWIAVSIYEIAQQMKRRRK